MDEKTIIITLKESNGDLVSIETSDGKVADGKPTDHPFPAEGEGLAGLKRADVIFWYQHNPTCFWYRGRRYCV